VLRRVAICAVAAVVAHVGAARAGASAASGQRVSADVIVCDGAIDCWLAGAVAPSGWVRAPSRQLVVDGVGATYKPELLVIATGEIGGTPLPEKAVTVGDVQAQGATATVDLALHLEDVPSDHYVGTIRLAGDGGTIEVPLDLRVRSGPLGAAVWLVIGILLGLFAKWWSERGAHEARILQDIELLTRLTDAAPADDRAIVVDQLGGVRDLLLQGRLDDADAELARIRTRREQLAALAQLAVALPGDPDVAAARDMIRRRRDTEATVAIESLQQRADARRGGRARAPASAVTSAAPVLPWWVRARQWFLRQMLGRLVRLVVIALVFAIGLYSLYVAAGATFGAQPLYDRLALILWGLGSEVTSRNLGNLAGLLGTRVASGASTPPPTTTAARTPAPTPASGRVHLPPFTIKPAPPTATREESAWPKNKLDTAALIAKQRTGKGVRVAVVDSGVKLAHPDLDFSRIEVCDIRSGGDGDDDYGHGTCMVSLVASALGVCPGATIVSIRVLDSQGAGSADDLRAGIEMAIARKCDVISISAGQSTPDDALKAAVQKAQAAGMLVVGAVLNDSPETEAYPADLPMCVSVTPSDEDDSLYYDSAPSWVTCGAPGVSVPAFGTSGRVTITGSSPATALVAGTCAMLLQAKARGPARTALACALADTITKTATLIDGGRLIAPMNTDKEIEG
jgi:hypothetical protein